MDKELLKHEGPQVENEYELWTRGGDFGILWRRELGRFATKAKAARRGRDLKKLFGVRKTAIAVVRSTREFLKEEG